MKIGIMGRTLDDGKGIGIGNRHDIDNIIKLDRENEYVVFYKTSKTFGRYQDYSNVKEILLEAPNKLIWDQVLVPNTARKEGVQLIFSPKFTVPLLSEIPTVVICHGLEYYTFPQFYERYLLMYVKIFLPLYYQKAVKVVAISNDLKDDIHKYVKVPYEKMETVYFGTTELFYPREDKQQLEAIKEKRQLPEDYIICLPHPYEANKLYPRKNLDNIVKAFMLLREKYPSLKLLLAGKRCDEYIAEVFGQDMANDPGFFYAGWVPQEEMPYLYSMAKMLVFPSYSESFGLPIVESMACGCPVITSTTTCCPEIAGDAGLLVDPTDFKGLSQAMDSILSKPELSQELSEKGFKRAKEFSWEKSAEKLIRIFQEEGSQVQERQTA